eukprot:16890_1
MTLQYANNYRPRPHQIMVKIEQNALEARSRHVHSNNATTTTLQPPDPLETDTREREREINSSRFAGERSPSAGSRRTQTLGVINVMDSPILNSTVDVTDIDGASYFGGSVVSGSASVVSCMHVPEHAPTCVCDSSYSFVHDSGTPFVPDSGAQRERDDAWRALYENQRTEELNFSVYDLSERETSLSDRASVVNAPSSAGAPASRHASSSTASQSTSHYARRRASNCISDRDRTPRVDMLQIFLQNLELHAASEAPDGKSDDGRGAVSDDGRDYRRANSVCSELSGRSKSDCERILSR